MHVRTHMYSHRTPRPPVIPNPTRSTPSKKVTTLAPATLRLAAHVRNKLNLWAGAAQLGPLAAGSGGGAGGMIPAGARALDVDDGDFELAVRSGSDGWVLVHGCGGRRLLVGLDVPPAPSGLMGVSGHVGRLAGRLFPGVFA